MARPAPASGGGTYGVALPRRAAATELRKRSSAFASCSPDRSIATTLPRNPGLSQSATRTVNSLGSVPAGSALHASSHSAAPNLEHKYASYSTAIVRVAALTPSCMDRLQSLPGTKSHD